MSIELSRPPSAGAEPQPESLIEREDRLHPQVMAQARQELRQIAAEYRAIEHVGDLFAYGHVCPACAHLAQ
jgi:hypothetical protein